MTNGLFLSKEMEWERAHPAPARLDPKRIAALSRAIDHTGDFILNVDHIAELIDTYGKVCHARGEAK